MIVKMSHIKLFNFGFISVLFYVVGEALDKDF